MASACRILGGSGRNSASQPMSIWPRRAILAAVLATGPGLRFGNLDHSGIRPHRNLKHLATPENQQTRKLGPDWDRMFSFPFRACSRLAETSGEHSINRPDCLLVPLLEHM